MRRATDADVDAVAHRIADAFQHLAVSAWLVAEPALRLPVLRDVFTIHARHAVATGCVWTTDDGAGVAVWLPGAPTAIEGYDDRLAAAAGVHLARFQHLDRAFERHHPDLPHEYLAFLAVAPDAQRAGRGTALLEWHHRHLDRTGTPAYLEATSLPARRLYLRHGYRDRHPPITLPDGPRLWPMWRQP